MNLLAHRELIFLSQLPNFSYGRIVSTLRPQSLTSEDYLDLSHHTQVSFYIPPEAALLGRSTFGASNPGLSQLTYHTQRKEPYHTPFPAGTHGFLYYFLPPFAPPLAGEVRFRITSSQDPSSFSSGHDLRHPVTTLPLSWSLRRIVSSTFRQRLESLLLYDGLVTPEVLTDAIKSTPVRHHTSVAGLYAFGQPFYLDLQSGTCMFDIFAVIDGKNVAERAVITSPAYTANVYYLMYLYTGGPRFNSHGALPYLELMRIL